MGLRTEAVRSWGYVARSRGGVVIVPALIYLAGFTQHRATGTSLAVLLPPIGFAAMWEYYRHDNVNVSAQ
jgi:uncharacterized membrane protein YfcA